ncbi:MAG: phosphate ABC transporter permease subunit PstC [Candidatus Aegiribacteria sp.]|nr:phosphate ABC transporter permease subunit PstC [Candidatus Aegiribacteria sp.]
MKYSLLFAALASILIVMMIGFFTFREALPAFRDIGLGKLLTESVWRPGQGQYGILAMIIGSGLVTAGAVILGVPLAIGCAIFLSEIAHPKVRAIVKPCVELLAGIPSVVYGLFGMVIIVPIVRGIDVPGNTGFGLFSASIVLAVMILPTITSVAEHAIRSVPKEFREGSLAMGATKWETIQKVIIPGARSGIISAIVLGLGRALGETIAMIMVIGNSVIIPAASTGNPLSIFLSRARTLTGNIAVEINYATGLHESALFATGVILFVLIMIVNSSAKYLMSRGKLEKSY